MMNNIRFLIVYLVFSNFTHAQTVTIGTQVWMTKNLNLSTFRNGDTIPEAKTNEEWEKAGNNKQPAWCYYENDLANGVKYGVLYNFYAVNDPRGLAPVGYHIPTIAEWDTLITFLGGEDVAGKKLKNQRGWSDYDDQEKIQSGNGTNKSGFSGLPGGYRIYQNGFGYLSEAVFWWSYSDFHSDTGMGLGLFNDIGVLKGDCKGGGCYVRCIKD